MSCSTLQCFAAMSKSKILKFKKEVGFKIHGNPELTLNDVKVRDFFPTDSSTEILVGRGKYEVHFIFIEDYVLGYCHSIK